MLFENMPIREADGEDANGSAVGAILAHGLSKDGLSLKKGHALGKADLKALLAAGISHVLAFRLEDGDIGEDEAAGRLADKLLTDHVSTSAAFTGRANLFADVDGICVYEREALDQLNMIDEAITVAVLPPCTPVSVGQMIATVKIIPFAVPGLLLDKALQAMDKGLFAVQPYRQLSVGLIETTLPYAHPKPSGKLRRVTTDRLSGIGASLVSHNDCDHESEALAKTIRAQAAEVDLILIAGASATTDRRDIVPVALIKAGGTIDHFGMPVDPGNLLMLGRMADTPVIGLPGCARSPKLNGFDWVLERIAAGVPVTSTDIMRMGSGGLLKEIGSRPQPRSRGVVADKPRIAAIILAAGQSSRMGGENKLLATIKGQSMIAHVVDNVGKSGVSSTVVVTGRDADAVARLAQGKPVKVAHNPDFESGMASSLRVGLNALPTDTDGAIICLGDMPFVTPDHIDKIIAAFDEDEGRGIIVPSHDGKWGNPVLWAATYFDDMRAITGDKGARELLHKHAERVYDVTFTDDAILRDFDTPESLKGL